MVIDKPFIHLFKTPYGHYMFDVNKNIIIKISAPLYEYLNNDQIGIKCEPNDDVNKTINELKKEGFLSSNRVSEIQHPADELLEYRLNNKIRMVTLQVTQQCNLRCHYCVYSGTGDSLNRLHSQKRMNFETAKKAIDFFLEHSKDSPVINIGFYGGEPLLEFKLISKCIEYAKEKANGRNVTFNLTTNATLLSKEIIEFFLLNDVHILISLDGPKEIHDKHRVLASNGCGSFDTIIKNIEQININYPEYIKNISFNMVLDPDNDFNCLNSFFADYKTLINIANFRSTIIDNRYSNTELSINENYVSSYAYEVFKAYLNKLGYIGDQNISPIALDNYRNIDNLHKKLNPQVMLPQKAHHGGPCVPGEMRLFIDSEGNFFPCERVSEISKVMNIGNLNEGFDLKKVRKLLNIGKLNEEECKNCWVFARCSLCASSADGIDHLSSEIKRNQCEGMRQSLENQFRDYLAFKEMNHRFSDY